MILSNPSAERAVLSAIIKYGSDIFYDVSDILTDKCFTIDSNSNIFQCIKKSIEKDLKSKSETNLNTCKDDASIGKVCKSIKELEEALSQVAFEMRAVSEKLDYSKHNERPTKVEDQSLFFI